MLTSSEFRELLSIFSDHKVRFLIVGGYAVMKYSEPRFTKDLDLWIAIDQDNASAVYESLKEFGAPLSGLTVEDFTDTSSFYQMGRAPLRIDILMSIPGVEFEAAWLKREVMMLDTVALPFISREDLIKAKQASGRPQDLLDMEALKNDAS
jgi:hypothetical protein